MNIQIEYVENQSNSFKKQITEIRKVIDDLGKNRGPGGGGDVSLDDFSKLLHEVSQLKKDYDQFKQDTNGNLKFLGDSLNLKADKNDLHELEARIMDKLNEIIKNLLGQFADKNDTKKRLANLEKNVLKCYSLIRIGIG